LLGPKVKELTRLDFREWTGMESHIQA
jgi:hypothetical protein